MANLQWVKKESLSGKITMGQYSYHRLLLNRAGVGQKPFAIFAERQDFQQMHGRRTEWNSTYLLQMFSMKKKNYDIIFLKYLFTCYLNSEVKFTWIHKQKKFF